MIFKIDFKKLIISLLIPWAVGGLSAFLTSSSMENYEGLNRPPLSPPGIVFPIVWAVLYTLMGISLYLVWNDRDYKGSKIGAYVLFGIQLLLNLMWSPIFFNAQMYLVAFIVLLLLWVFVLLTIISFYKISKPAAYLMIPYLLWLTFAGYLNLGIYRLN